MNRLPTRTLRALAFLTLFAAAACSDEQEPIAAPTVTPQFAAGDVYVVTNTNDSGVGSLRWALSYATGGEMIRFDASLAGQTIALDSALDVRTPLTIEGPAGRGITLSGGGTTRHILLNHSGTLTLRNLTLRDGHAETSGGSLYGLGAVVIENSALLDNRAEGPGAIVAGHVTLRNTTVSGNVATYGPAGSGDPVKYAPINAAHVVVENSTITNNTDGGVSATQLVLRNSVVANNGVGRECRTQDLVLEGRNLASDDTCGGPTGAIIADPLLGPLADNGGPAPSHALLVGSPAINQGTGCTVAYDQRYVARDAQCDLGAIEFLDFTQVRLTIDPDAAVDRKTGWLIVSGTVQCTRPESFEVAVTFSQTQKRGKQSTVVQANGSTSVSCTTSARPWSAALVAAGKGFEPGSATADAASMNTAPWITPAASSRTVKLLP